MNRRVFLGVLATMIPVSLIKDQESVDSLKQDFITADSASWTCSEGTVKLDDFYLYSKDARWGCAARAMKVLQEGFEKKILEDDTWNQISWLTGPVDITWDDKEKIWIHIHAFYDTKDKNIS